MRPDRGKAEHRTDLHPFAASSAVISWETQNIHTEIIQKRKRGSMGWHTAVHGADPKCSLSTIQDLVAAHGALLRGP